MLVSKDPLLLPLGERSIFMEFDSGVEEKGEEEWSLVFSISGSSHHDFFKGAAGLICSMERVDSIALAIREPLEEVVRNFMSLGHSLIPVIFKKGTKEEVFWAARAASKCVCHCHITISCEPR